MDNHDSQIYVHPGCEVNGDLGGDDWRVKRENDLGEIKRKILEKKNRYALNSLSVLMIGNIYWESGTGFNALQATFYLILTTIF